METEEKDLKTEVREKVSGYISAGFGLVAGLAWNDAIKEFIETVFPQSGNTLVAKFSYAVIVTVLAVIVTVYFVRLIKKTHV